MKIYIPKKVHEQKKVLSLKVLSWKVLSRKVLSKKVLSRKYFRYVLCPFRPLCL